jgi:DtxR family Mn-dependent transcriptional regulator
MVRQGVPREQSAQVIISRHEALTRFFAQGLGIDQETAEADACKIEHVISPLSMERLAKFVEFMEDCPLTRADFFGRYKYYLPHRKLPQDCSNRGMKKRK